MARIGKRKLDCTPQRMTLDSYLFVGQLNNSASTPPDLLASCSREGGLVPVSMQHIDRKHDTINRLIVRLPLPPSRN